MNLVTNVIRQKLEDPDICFVFPSEVVAAFWRRRSLLLSDRRAVRADRFLSWDTFKEQTFARRSEAVPVNGFIRICFAADVLSRNAGGKTFIQALVFPVFADSWQQFVRPLARMLPSLEQLVQDRQVSVLLDPRLRKDLELIARLYKEFLENHGLFEPLHVTAGEGIPRSSVIFFPEVVLDFSEYEHVLDGNLISIVHDTPPESGEVVAYSNARVEVRHACLACRELLDAGTEPSSIAVTLSDWEGYWEELRDTASRYDIPLVLRSGKPLSDYTEVNLYRLLSQCVSSGFSVGALKELFNNTAYPWKKPLLGRELVRFGIDNYGIQNLSGSGRSTDEWRRRLNAGASPGLLEFYRRFKREAESIITAVTFSGLRDAVTVFNSSFLDTKGFTESQSLPFSAALDLLSGIEESADYIRDLRLDSPFSLWMACLAERRYVRPFHGDGIPVYEYRVAAGICPEYHFILGVSREASEVRNPKYPFLPLNMMPEDIQAAGDFTEPFFRIYARSGAQVVFSCGKESFDGPVTPVRYFPEIEPSPAPRDAYASELQFWAGASAGLERPHSQQQAGLRYMASTGLLQKGFDLTSQPLGSPGLAGRVSARLAGDGDIIRISPTGLDTWNYCKYRYLLSRALGLEQLDFDAVYTSPLDAGILFHKLLAAVLRRLDTDGRRVPTGLDNIRDFVHRVFSSWVGTRFLEPVRNYLRRRAEEYIRAFLQTEGEVFPDTRMRALEESFEVPTDATGVALYGRIDRISERDDGYIVVDYKTHLWKKAAGMVTPEGDLYSFQIPIYLLLVEGSYGPVAEALYYDIHKGSYENVFGGAKPWFDEEMKDNLLGQTVDTVSRMYRAITEGDYQTPVPRGGCVPCEFRPVCREKYRVR